MTLLTRLSRLLQADVHALLDRIEEPEALLKQAVREMDAVLEEDRRRLRAHELERGLLGDRRNSLLALLPQLAEELDLCFALERQDLARSLIRRRLETEQALSTLARKDAALETECSRLREQIADHALQLDQIRQRAELMACARPEPGDRLNREGAAVSERDVDIAWLREQQLRSRP